jgi:hypothetical protein
MFTHGSNEIKGALCLNFQTIPTDTGYVQMDATKTYTANVGPASNAIPERGAKTSHGSRRIIQRKNKPVVISSMVIFFTI